MFWNKNRKKKLKEKQVNKMNEAISKLPEKRVIGILRKKDGTCTLTSIYSVYYDEESQDIGLICSEYSLLNNQTLEKYLMKDLVADFVLTDLL